MGAQLTSELALEKKLTDQLTSDNAQLTSELALEKKLTEKNTRQNLIQEALADQNQKLKDQNQKLTEENMRQNEIIYSLSVAKPVVVTPVVDKLDGGDAKPVVETR